MKKQRSWEDPDVRKWGQALHSSASAPKTIEPCKHKKWNLTKTDVPEWHAWWWKQQNLWFTAVEKHNRSVCKSVPFIALANQNEGPMMVQNQVFCNSAKSMAISSREYCNSVKSTSENKRGRDRIFSQARLVSTKWPSILNQSCDRPFCRDETCDRGLTRHRPATIFGTTCGTLLEPY